LSNQTNSDEELAIMMGKAYGRDAKYSNTHCIALFECEVNMLRALMEEVGPNRALEAIRPFNIFVGKYIAGMAKQRFGLKGDDVEAVAMPYFWAHCGTSNGHIKPMEIREGKAIVELYACGSEIFHAPPEMCVAISHYIAEGICEAINPNYEFVFTHHLANGDDRCRYVVKKKSDKFSLDTPGRLERTIPVDLSQAERDMWVEFESIGELGYFTTISKELVGSERTMEIVAPLQKDTGRRLGALFLKNAGGKSDLSTLKERLDLLCCPFSQTESSALIKDGGIEKEIADCPFKQYFPANPHNLPIHEMCMQLEEVLKGVCEAMNPDYEFTFDRMMSKGDKTCHWVARKKAIDKGARQQESTGDDSLGY
jgi:predicted hydrocarbon binding protein